ALTAGKSGKTPPGQLNGTGGQSNPAEPNRYYYHPDHLGSTSYITDATGEVYQHLEYFAFGETFVEEHSNTDRTPYLYNGKELDEETGLYYYGARYYDAQTSVWVSVDPLAEKYVAYSPYNYTLNNPIKYDDPDGRWVPGADKDNNVIVTREKGDTKKSLRQFMGDGYSKKEIRQMWRSMDKSTGSINLTKQVGGVFKEMTNAMEDAKKAGLPSTVGFLAGTEKAKGQNYNCWGTCIALNDGKKLEGKGPGTGIGIPRGSSFDAELKVNYVPVSRDDATVGQTVLRYADKTTNSIDNGHGAIFMGVDNSGNEYIFSKNGWYVAPEIFDKSYVDYIYGTPSIGGNNEVRGINSGESGYYQKK
ncbi:MAG: RHS repeat-associated core domain-containing protein, partial [Cyclobacteriaceae bacterium]|nr:RHS repeat-associated core domain-containing protein [Cyclobacteriaceae bacterium]